MTSARLKIGKANNQTKREHRESITRGSDVDVEISWLETQAKREKKVVARNYTRVLALTLC